MDKKYLLLGVIVLALIGLAVVLQMNTVPLEDTATTPVVEDSVPGTQETPEAPDMVDLEGDTIIDVALANPELSTAVAAIEAAGLVDFLNSPGSYTIFAPTNDAFEALPEGTLEDLLDPENVDDLIDVLTYHVTLGDFLADDVATLGEIPTLQGQFITVSSEGDMVTLNGDANITQTDVQAVNGVIHIVDSVLLPPTE